MFNNNHIKYGYLLKLGCKGNKKIETTRTSPQKSLLLTPYYIYRGHLLLR